MSFKHKFSYEEKVKIVSEYILMVRMDFWKFVDVTTLIKVL